MLAALLVGLILGFAGSMPIAGPTAALVVSLGLEGRLRAAFSVAVGAAVAESAYAAAAFWGLTTVLHRFPIVLSVSRIAAGIMLASLGLYLAVRRPRRRRRRIEAHPNDGLGGAIVGLTIGGLNPTLLVTWAVAVGIAHSTGLLRVDAKDALPFAAAAGIGMVGWAGVLISLLGRFRDRVKLATIGRIIRVMGAALVVGGIALGVSAIVRP